MGKGMDEVEGEVGMKERRWKGKREGGRGVDKRGHHNSLVSRVFGLEIRLTIHNSFSSLLIYRTSTCHVC